MSRALAAACFGTLVLLAAATFDSLSLYVPGIALLACAAGACAWIALARRGASIERHVSAVAVEEDEPLEIELRLRRGRVRGGATLAGAPLEAPLRIRRRTPPTLVVEQRFPRRGRHALAPTRLELSDPLQLVRFSLDTAADEILVLPRIDPVAAPDAAGARRDATRSGARDAELEFDSLRPYRPGAPASRIHWPTVARSQTMMERRLSAAGDLRPLIVLDTRGPASPAALDCSVRAAASLAAHLARAGGCALILPGDRRATQLDPDMRGWRALHVRLALVEESAAPPLRARVDRGGALLWVAAAATPPAALLHARAPARYLITPAPPAGRAPAFTVAGCVALRLERRLADAA